MAKYRLLRPQAVLLLPTSPGCLDCGDQQGLPVIEVKLPTLTKLGIQFLTPHVNDNFADSGQDPANRADPGIYHTNISHKGRAELGPYCPSKHVGTC